MNVSESRLKKKGWKEEEISRAKKIIAAAERKKHPGIVFLERFSYWLAIVVAIIATFAFSAILIVLFMALPTWAIYLATTLFALCTGTFFVMIIRDIEHMKIKHHMFNAIIIPASAIIILALATDLANRIILKFGLGTTQSIIGICLAYVLGLFAPYIISLAAERRKKSNATG